MLGQMRARTQTGSKDGFYHRFSLSTGALGRWLLGGSNSQIGPIEIGPLGEFGSGSYYVLMTDNVVRFEILKSASKNHAEIMHVLARALIYPETLYNFKKEQVFQVS